MDGRFELSLTARDLIHRIAHDVGIPYRDVAKRVNHEMELGHSFMESIQTVSREHGLDPDAYSLDPELVAREVRKILATDYSQTLMISAVLAHMFESKGNDRLPSPAFFAFLELLSEVTDQGPVITTRIEPPKDLEKWATRVIELTTTLVSLVNAWSKDGIAGVSNECPPSLVKVAKAVYVRTKMYQHGIWSCLSCGKLVNLNETRSLLCAECDTRLYNSDEAQEHEDSVRGLDRIGYGRTTLSENDD